MNTKKILVFLLLLGFVFPASAKEVKAGVTLLAKGSVVSLRNKTKVRLKRGSSIYELDTIRVGHDGLAHFKMIDRAEISLQHNSVLKIKKYRYHGKGSKANLSYLELISGGLRTITGIIGKGDKKAYELHTPMATIGVRGTTYEVKIVPKGMYVAAWGGSIGLRSPLKGACNMSLGDSQPFMFLFIDNSGKCKGLKQVPSVFSSGYSSDILASKDGGGIREPLSLLQKTKANKLIADNFSHQGLMVSLPNASAKNKTKSNSITSSTPVFQVGLNYYYLPEKGRVSNFKQSIGGLPVSWGFWNEYSVVGNETKKNDSDAKGILWTSYDQTNPLVVSALKGRVNYNNVIDSQMYSSKGSISNLKMQMTVNFDSGQVTDGALSVNTKSDKWLALFDGKINSGTLDLELNGASVVDSNPKTPSVPRDASGYISGDFVGKNAEAVVGGFRLKEDGDSTNNIEGTFIVK